MAKKSKTNPLKIILMILIFILLVGGGVIAAVYFQVLKIPGLEFIAKLSQKPNSAIKMPKVKEDSLVLPSTPSPKKKDPIKKPIPEKSKVLPPDLKKGAKQTAKLWNEIETKKLVEIVKNWSNPDLAKIIMQMDTGQASALLEALEPSKSSALSKIIEKESSQVSSDSSTNL